MSINNINRNKVSFAGHQSKKKNTKASMAITTGVGLIGGTAIGAGFNRSARYSADKAYESFTQNALGKLQELMETNNVNDIKINGGELVGSFADGVKDKFKDLAKGFASLEASLKDGKLEEATKKVKKIVDGKITPVEEKVTEKIITLSTEAQDKAKKISKASLTRKGAIVGAAVGTALGLAVGIKIALKRQKDASENIPSQAISMK